MEEESLVIIAIPSTIVYMFVSWIIINIILKEVWIEKTSYMISVWTFLFQVLYFEFNHLILIIIAKLLKKDLIIFFAPNFISIFIVGVILYYYMEFTEELAREEKNHNDGLAFLIVAFLLIFFLGGLFYLQSLLKEPGSNNRINRVNRSNRNVAQILRNREENKQRDNGRILPRYANVILRNQNDQRRHPRQQRHPVQRRANPNINPNIDRNQIVNRNNDQVNDNDLRKINSILYQPYYNLRNKS